MLLQDAFCSDTIDGQLSATCLTTGVHLRNAKCPETLIRQVVFIYLFYFYFFSIYFFKNSQETLKETAKCKPIHVNTVLQQ